MERPSENLIYDRTLSDVQRVAELNRKISAGSASAEEVQEWFSAKGALNYEDLNRIESWTEFLSNQLKSYGYNAPITKRAEQTYTYYEKPEPGDEPVARLPEGYRELTYIESTGTQYVNAGHTAQSDNLKIAIRFAYTSVATGQSIFGAQNSTGTLYGVIPYTSEAGRPYLYVGTSSKILSTPVSANVVNAWEISAVNGGASWNANGTTSKASYSGAPNQGFPYFIFANNSGGSMLQPCSAKLYSMQIYDNDVLVRDFIPCRNPSGDVGLYDVANDMFYTNAGTGVFATGEIIEYIENAGGGSNGPTAITVTYTDWRVWDIPHLAEINRIRDNVNSLRDGFYNLSDWLEIAYKNNPNFEDVNTLEWDMQTIYNWLKLMVLNFKYSGEVYAGEAW